MKHVFNKKTLYKALDKYELYEYSDFQYQETAFHIVGFYLKYINHNLFLNVWTLWTKFAVQYFLSTSFIKVCKNTRAAYV